MKERDRVKRRGERERERERERVGGREKCWDEGERRRKVRKERERK